MDPNACLLELRRLIEQMMLDGDYGDAMQLAALIASLDRWLSSGGLLPRAWER